MVQAHRRRGRLAADRGDEGRPGRLTTPFLGTTQSSVLWRFSESRPLNRSGYPPLLPHQRTPGRTALLASRPVLRERVLADGHRGAELRGDPGFKRRNRPPNKDFRGNPGETGEGPDQGAIRGWADFKTRRGNLPRRKTRQGQDEHSDVDFGRRTNRTSTRNGPTSNPDLVRGRCARVRPSHRPSIRFWTIFFPNIPARRDPAILLAGRSDRPARGTQIEGVENLPQHFAGHPRR